MPYQYARLTGKFYKNVIRGNLTSRLCHSVELRMAVIAGGASAASLETCRGVPVVGQSGHAASGSEMKTRRRVVMRHLRGQGVRAPRFVCRTQAGAGIDKIGRVSSGGRGSNVSRSKGEGAAPSGGAGALRMEAVKIAQLHEGADDPNVETCRRHAASCRGEYGLSLRQRTRPLRFTDSVASRAVPQESRTRQTPPSEWERSLSWLRMGAGAYFMYPFSR